MTQTIARRLLPALGIALASSLLLGALAVTAGGGADPALPARFGVAAPRLGDAWHYNATLTGLGDGQRAAQSHYAPFTALLWAGAGQARGADGRLHTANLLALDGLARLDSAAVQQEGAGDTTAWTLGAVPVWVQAGSRDVVQSGFFKAVNHTETDDGLAGGVGASARRFVQVSVHTEFGGLPHCLAWNALQGAHATLAAPLELFGACQVGAGFLHLREGLRFKAAALESANGVQAVRFDSDDGAYAAWLAPGIPYPVRLARFPDSLGGGDASSPALAPSLVLDLAGFRPGDGPLAAVDRPTDPAPPLAFAPRTPWGLDDSGVVHPFPLSAAYAAAKEDPLFPDLRAFLAAHPEAYAAAAEYAERDMGPGQQERVWRITVADRGETLGFAVIQKGADSLLPAGARGQAPGSTAAYNDHGASLAIGKLPASGVPAQGPTAASLLARWATFDGSGTPANAWGFHLECETASDGSCPAARIVAHVGVRRDVDAPVSLSGLPGLPYGTGSSARVARLVTFAPDGQALRIMVRDNRVDTSSPGNPLPPVPTAGSGFEVRSDMVAGLPASAWLPAPEQAAGVGALGILLGTLYWLWPKLKAVAFLGLSSRVRGDSLLEHPARRRLVHLVEAEPGIHFHELAQRAGLGNGTAVHHLRKLAGAGQLTVRRSGRYACYFPGPRVEPRTAARAPLLKSSGARRVLATVRAHPGLSNLELAQATGLTPSTVNYHAQRLATVGLVEALRDGRHVRFRPLAPLLARHWRGALASQP